MGILFIPTGCESGVFAAVSCGFVGSDALGSASGISSGRCMDLRSSAESQLGVELSPGRRSDSELDVGTLLSEASTQFVLGIRGHRGASSAKALIVATKCALGGT